LHGADKLRGSFRSNRKINKYKIMRVLLVTTHLEPGGIPHYVISLAEALKKRGHKVFVASRGGKFTDTLANLGIEHIKLNIQTKSELSPKILFSLIKLLKIVKQKNIQIIHAQTRVTQVLSFLLSKFSKVPYISTCHGFFRPHFFRRKFPFWGKKVIAISEAVEAHLIKDMKIKKEDIRLIHNGIDCRKFKVADLGQINQFRQKFGIKNDPVVGIIARLSDVKGHIYLIEAFSQVLEYKPHTQLLIAGDGKMKAQLVELSKNLGADNNVIFIPAGEDISLVLSVMDIFVMPSIQEGLGLAIMQAQALGLPVIGSSVGGIVSLISDSQTGLLVPVGDSERIAKSILKLLNDKNLAARLGQNAKRNIEENFSLEKMAAETEKLYNEIVGG